MAAHDKALIIDSLSNRWYATASPPPGTTCIATVTPARGKDRVVLTSLGWSIQNVTLLGTAATSTLQVSSATIAGTVFGSWRIRPSNIGGDQDCWNTQYTGKKGVALCVAWLGPSASVSQDVSIAGWFDTMSDG